MLDNLKPEPNPGSATYVTYSASEISVHPGADWAARDLRYSTYLQDLIRSGKMEIDTVVVFPGPFGPEAIRNAGKLLALQKLDGSVKVRCQCVDASPEVIALMICREYVLAPTFNRIDLAVIFRDLLVSNQWRHRQLGDALGLSGHTITNTLRLEKLHPRVKDMIRTGSLDVAKAKHLISEEPSRQVDLAQECAVKAWTEKRLIKELKGDFRNHLDQGRERPVDQPSKYITAANEALEDAIPHPTSLIEGQGGGLTLKIDFHSLEALAGIAEQLEGKVGGNTGYSGSVSIGPMSREKFDDLFAKLVEDF